LSCKNTTYHEGVPENFGGGGGGGKLCLVILDDLISDLYKNQMGESCLRKALITEISA
jgi:hypothetical protein